ncbi:MAG: Rpn family recombination-promoting nuclease/putative transposase [Spirochaetales bacterium]|nr:Rpn family recombination-promoting nuclease/putative transposase [Spirochaetales bacterium]
MKKEKRKDRSSKLFFSNPEHAREIVGLALRRLDIGARASGISIEDPVVSFLDTDISLERLLDKLYKVTLTDGRYNTFCLIGLENQSYYDAHMLIRAGITSLLVYDWKLSLNEELKPNFIVVLNMSDSKWKGPLSLEDYFSEDDLKFFGPLFVNVRMVVIDPFEMDDKEIEGLKTDLELVLKVIKKKADKEVFCDYIKSDDRFKNLDEVTAKLIAELINIKIEDGGTNVCKALDDLVKDSKAEGEAIGRENELFELRREGLLTKDYAAKRLGLSVEEYSKREDRFFS